MKILFISDNAILGYGGGSVENKKHYDALKKICEITGAELKVISRDTTLNDALNVEIKKNRKIDIAARLVGHSTYLYFTWFQKLEIVKKYNPDILYLGRSRFGFMAKSVKKVLPNCKVITNVDNVEVDYVDGYFALKKGIINYLYRSLEIFCVKRDERDAVNYSDCLIYLTKRNAIRIRDLYKRKEPKPVIIPICLENELELTLESTSRTVVFIGSLDYAANILAVKRILELWKLRYEQNDRIKLLIAGRNPNKEVISMVEEVKNTQLIQNFTSIIDIIPKHSLMLAPIEKGAGMKVKVAETLSMGLMIAASDEALIGYEEALKECQEGLIRANTSEDFCEAIDHYIQMNVDELDRISHHNKKVFEKYYSYERSRVEIMEIVNKVIQEGGCGN